MSNPRSPEEFYDRLSNDLNWRKREISFFYLKIHSLADKAQETMLRAGAVILYSHWEGFVKFASNSYLLFVAEVVKRRKLRIRELSDNFAALILKSTIEPGSEYQVVQGYQKIVRDYVRIEDARAQVPVSNVINTRSNLNADSFREIVLHLGLDYSPFASKEKAINELVQEYRNKIAHGKQMLIDMQAYDQYHKVVLELLDTYYNCLCNAVAQSSYLYK